MTSTDTQRALLAAVLALGTIAVATRLGKEIGSLRSAQRQAEHATPGSYVRGLTGGIDPFGRRFLVPPPRARYMVLFELHAASLRAELASWDATAVQLRSRPEFFLTGYCDGPECSETILQGQIHGIVPVIQYGDFETMDVVSRADARGECLLLDRLRDRISTFSCTPSASSGDAITAKVVALVQP